MGCCFSKELNPKPISERTSLLQTSVTESCLDQEVKKYSAVTELAEERRPEYSQPNRHVDVGSDASSTKPSASLRSVDKRSSSMQDGARVWDEFKDVSRNKPPGDVSKDSDIQAEADTAVLSSVKRRIAENAVKRANWFCEVDLSEHADSTPFKPRCENPTVTEALVPNCHHIRPTRSSADVSSEVSLTLKQNQEHVHAQSSICQKSDVFFTTKYLYDDPFHSDKKRSDFLTSDCSEKRRTQSFYSICSIDADDLVVERDPSAVMLPGAFDRTDLLTNTETRVFFSTSLSNAALETVNWTKETQEDGETVSEGVSAETLPLNTAHVLPDVIGASRDLGSDENAVLGNCVSVPSEDRVMEKSEKLEHRSDITGLCKTVDETIPDLLERNDRFSDSVLNHTDVDRSCQTRVNAGGEFINISNLEGTETDCEGHHSETPEGDPKSLSSESGSLDNEESRLNSCVDCREPKQAEPNTEVNPSPMSRKQHEPSARSPLEAHNVSAQDTLHSEISRRPQVTEDQRTSSSESESDVKSQGFILETSYRVADALNLNSKSCLSPGEDNVLDMTESICSCTEREAAATEPEPGSESSSLQSSNSFTSDISERNSAPQPETFQTGLVDYSGFDACLLLTHHDAEKREINLGTEDVTCHISSTELSDVVPESEIADEHVETSENSVHINSKADYDEPLEANQSSMKRFGEKSTSLTRPEQELSPPPLVTASNADFYVHANLLGDASQNLEDLIIGEEQMFPASAQKSLNTKEEVRSCLKENESLMKAECFNEHMLERPNHISLSIGRVKTSETELQNSKSMDLDLTPSRNDVQVIRLFLESSSEKSAPSLHMSPYNEPPDTFGRITLSKNSMQCESAHVPAHALLGKTDTQSSSDLSNQEPEWTHGDVQDVQMISTAAQQVDIDYRVPLGRTISPVFEIRERAHALEGHHGPAEGVECFVTSRLLQGYQLADEMYASGSACGLGAAETGPIPNFCADDKVVIPLPVEPDQVDLYASAPSYEIHLLSQSAITVPMQVENPPSLTSTNESERERGVLNMVSELLGKSEVNEDGDCSHFLSVWAAEPELESAWQCCLSEEEAMGRNGQEGGKSDAALDCERVQAFTAAYPYSLLVSDEACVWDWQSTYTQLVRLRPCCLA